MEEEKESTLDQQLHITSIPIAEWDASFLDKLRAVEILSSLFPTKEVTNYLKEKWDSPTSNIIAEDIPHIAKLAMKDILPAQVLDKLFLALKSSVPKFNTISIPDN